MKVFTLQDKVLNLISSQAEAVLKTGSHSSSLELSDNKTVSVVDNLVVKLLQECQSYLDGFEAEKAESAAQQQRKKDVSNFLVPPLPGLGTCNMLGSLTLSTAISSIISPHPIIKEGSQQSARCIRCIF